MIDYPSDFQEIWDILPNRVGSNPKPKALKAYNARIKEGATHEQIKNGAVRYRRFCEATNKINTEYALMKATFLGPDYHFDNEYQLPKSDWMQEAL